MHADIPELDKAGLRKFGITTGAMFVLLFGLAFPYVFEFDFPVWPWVLFGVLGGWALVWPQSLRGVYRAWMRLALLLNRITMPLVLGVVFYVMLLPIGLIMRMAGRDPLKRKHESTAGSYRQPSHEISDESLRNPF